MRQCLPINKPTMVRHNIAAVELPTDHVLLEVAEVPDDDGVLLTVRGKPVPELAVERSPVLQELQDVSGKTSLPFSEEAFWSWVDQAGADAHSTPVRTCCTNIEVCTAHARPLQPAVVSTRIRFNYHLEELLVQEWQSPANRNAAEIDVMHLSLGHD